MLGLNGRLPKELTVDKKQLTMSLPYPRPFVNCKFVNCQFEIVSTSPLKHF